MLVSQGEKRAQSKTLTMSRNLQNSRIKILESNLKSNFFEI